MSLRHEGPVLSLALVPTRKCTDPGKQNGLRDSFLAKAYIRSQMKKEYS